MKRIIVVVTLIACLFSMYGNIAVGAGKTIAVFPFYDDSGYRGPWLLYQEVPGMLGDMLYDEYFRVISMDSVLAVMPGHKKPTMISRFFSVFRNKKVRQKILTDLEMLTMARKMNADYAITGIVDNFNYSRKGAGDVLVGGYKSYVAKVKVSHVRVLRVTDGTPLGTVEGESEKTEKGLGLELFGKPRSRDLEFYSLDSLDYGSKRFLNTLMGEAAVEALNQVQKEIRAIITLPDTNWFSQKQFKIISISEGSVNVNAGSADGIKPGDKFRVFTSESGVLVGKINITSVWADHISKGEILEGRDEIRLNDVIMPE